MHSAMRMQRFTIFSSNILRLYILFLCALLRFVVRHNFVFDIFDFLYFQSVPFSPLVPNRAAPVYLLIGIRKTEPFADLCIHP